MILQTHYSTTYLSLGEPFLLTISYDPAVNKMKAELDNGVSVEMLFDLAAPAVPQMSYFSLGGDIEVNFAGFVKKCRSKIFAEGFICCCLHCIPAFETAFTDTLMVKMGKK